MAKKQEQTGIYKAELPDKEPVHFQCLPSHVLETVRIIVAKAGFTTTRKNTTKVNVIVRECCATDGNLVWVWHDEIEVQPPYVELTDETYHAEINKLLCKLPPEFQEYISGQAYARGHASGYEECLSIAQDMAFDLTEVMDKYLARLVEEGMLTIRK